MTFLTSGWRQRASLKLGVFSKPVVRMFSAPFGTPASSAKSASERTDKGVSGDGLTTKVQPVASAAPAFRATILGKIIVSRDWERDRT